MDSASFHPVPYGSAPPLVPFLLRVSLLPHLDLNPLMVGSGGLTFGMPITSLPYLYSVPGLNFDYLTQWTPSLLSLAFSLTSWSDIQSPV